MMFPWWGRKASAKASPKVIPWDYTEKLVAFRINEMRGYGRMFRPGVLEASIAAGKAMSPDRGNDERAFDAIRKTIEDYDVTNRCICGYWHP
jgi:hypothetical protein